MKLLHPEFRLKSFSVKLKACNNLKTLVDLHNRLWQLQTGSTDLRKESLYLTVKKMVEKRIKELNN